MRRTLGRLTTAQVKNAKPKRGRYWALMPDGSNLYLQVTLGKHGTVNRSWLFRYELDGKRHDMGLGPLSDRSLAEAREKARSLRQLLLDGIDPLQAKQQARKERLAALAEEAKAITFKQCAEMYLRAHGDSWKNAKHAAQWRSTLETYAYPVLESLSVSDIDVGHVLKALEPIWRRIPETASRVRMRIESVLGYATARKFREGDNPARWRGHLATLLPAKGKIREAEHHPALPYEQIGAFMEELRCHSGIAARALEFVILTAARTGDILGNARDEKPPMKWRHVGDLKKRLWTVPSTKTDTEHRVPLPHAAARLLAEMKESSSGDIVFPGANAKQPLSNMAMLAVIRRINADRETRDLPRYVDPKQGDRDVTVHGFRSTFRDWAAEQTNYPNHVVEMALAHAIDDEVEAAYRRGDLFEKRRRLMQAWAEYCARPGALVAGATVTVLHEGARA